VRASVRRPGRAAKLASTRSFVQATATHAPRFGHTHRAVRSCLVARFGLSFVTRYSRNRPRWDTRRCGRDRSDLTRGPLGSIHLGASEPLPTRYILRPPSADDSNPQATS
jgi:hypothetical protein